MKRIAVITGASSGIGKALAQRFSEKSDLVINISRRVCEISNVVNIRFDLSQANQFLDLEEELAKYIGKKALIRLIHNASRLDKDSHDHLSIDRFQTVLNVNLIAPIRINQILLPWMAAGSSIVYLGSTLSEKAVKGAYSYIITKHATIGMMRALCQELDGRQIHTGCVCPGFTDTEMLRAHLDYDEKLLKRIGTNNGFHRLISPDEIAKAIEFLCENETLNGSVIHANLGQIES